MEFTPKQKSQIIKNQNIMKRTILLMAMALAVSVAFGQTAKKLIEKYKEFPGAEYTNTTEESLKNMNENPNPALTAEENERIRKNFKMSEQVQLKNLDEKPLTQLEKDIKALKGYDLLFVTNRNKESQEEKNVVQQVFSSMTDPTFKLQCYGDVKRNNVYNILVRVDMWNTVALARTETKLEPDLVVKAFMKNEAVNITTESAEMSEVVTDYKNGNVLIVIHGKEYPELHSEKEAAEYMKANHINWNGQKWIVGGAVKENYPHTDKKVVIEFYEKSKEK